MRVTPESLIRVAKETAQERAYNNPNVIAAYLIGSLLGDDPFLGGVTDIDLVFVHADQPSLRREIVKLTNDFHLDITHHAKKEYDPPRELRLNPWLGYEIYDPMLLFEREHFFEFTQAGVRAGFEFHRTAYVVARSRQLLDHGRQIWMDLVENTQLAGPVKVAKYLKSLHHAINAVAELNGPPLPERRILLIFPERAEAAQRSGLSTGLLGLLGGLELSPDTLSSWLPEWQADFLAAAEKPEIDSRIHLVRLAYYQKAFESILESERPTAVLWPLLRTWTLAASVLPSKENAPWQRACKQLGLTGPEFEARLEGLDHYLDDIEELLDRIAEADGVEPPSSF
jgi:hypothetical protein